MAIDKLRANISVSDEEFDSIFPEEVREFSNRHYTSVYISQRAAAFLAVKENVQILDIGSGTGKFCLVGAACTNAHFTGVEYRKYQNQIAQMCADRFALANVSFVYSNILDVDFEQFDAFYIFNPFLENIDRSAQMDQLIDSKNSDYEIFRQYVHDQLEKKKVGTRIVSYYNASGQIPDSYELKKSSFGGTLHFWEKAKWLHESQS